MKPTKGSLLVVLFICFALVQSRVYTRCGLTDELIKRNFPRSFIGNWVCMIENESGRDTQKVTNKADGSKSLGLFQINSKDWCQFGKIGGKCNMKCEDLTNENLVAATGCAKKVYNQLGFQAWNGWKKYCYGRTVSIPKCS